MPNEELDDDDRCPETGKRHVPDWTSVSTMSDGGELYVDVNCKNCGRSGCIGSSKTLAKEITW